MILVFDLRILGFGFGFFVFVGLSWQFWITDLKILYWCVWVFSVCSCGLKLGLWWKWVCVVGGGIDDWNFFSFCGCSWWLEFIFFLGGHWWCWQWWVLSLPLMVVMDVGEYERGDGNFDAGSNHNSCVVSVWWVPPFWQNVDLKVELCDWVFVTKQQFWSFWVMVEFGIWVMRFELDLWVMRIESCLNQMGPKCFYPNGIFYFSVIPITGLEGQV